MATVRAQRLLNNIIDGTTNGTALQTALGTSSIRADFQQVVNERSKARMIAATDNGATTVGQSATALLDLLESPTGNNEFSKNPTKFNQYIGPTIGASNALMNAYTNSTANLTSASSNRAVGAPIFTSSFAGNYSSRFIVNATTWNLPAMPNASPVSSGGNKRSLAGNGSTLVYCHRTVTFTSSTAVYTSTNGGDSWTGYQVHPSLTGDTTSVTYGAGLFVLVGSNGRCFTSPNGVTWTSRTSGTSSDLWQVKYANGRFVAVGNNVVIYSTDGITWTTASGSAAATFYGLEYVGNNTWIAIWNSTNILRSTDNGNSWSTVGTGVTNLSIATDGNGKVVIGTTSANMAYSSNYGASWGTNAIGGSLSTSWPVWGVAYYGGNFLFAQQAVGNIAYSRQSLPTSGFVLTGSGSGGVNPVPSFGPLAVENGLFVVDGRLCSDSSASTFSVMYKGQ